MSKELKHRFVFSEKSYLVREQKKIIIVTSDFVTKEDLKSFIEQKYDTKVIKINCLITNGKTKFRKRIKVTLPDKKKFYVTVDNFDKFEKMEQSNAKAV